MKLCTNTYSKMKLLDNTYPVKLYTNTYPDVLIEGILFDLSTVKAIMFAEAYINRKWMEYQRLIDVKLGGEVMYVTRGEDLRSRLWLTARQQSTLRNYSRI